jgi:uncharacterized membrane protein
MFTPTHLHAMLIHFPIALLLVAFLSEIISLFLKKEFFKNVAFYLLILGTLGTVAAYITGNAAGEGVEEGPLKIPMELHEQAATITLWLAIITAIFQITLFFLKYKTTFTRSIGIILFATLIAAVSRTAYLGGQLVYNHGAGVQLELPDFENATQETQP